MARRSRRTRAPRPGARPPAGRSRWSRAGRLLWWISPVLVFVATLAASAGMAAAAPAQNDPEGAPADRPPTVQPTTPPVDPLDPDDLEMSPSDREAEEELLNGGGGQNPCQPADGSTGGGDRGSIVPDDCWGQFPSSHYDIGCDEGAWNHIGRKVYCTFTDLAFQGARSTTATALWMVEWAYAFGVYQRLGGPAITIAEAYERELIGPLGLSHLAWFYAVAWAGISALRGRAAMAGGELAASVVFAGLAALLLANPSGYLEGAFDTMGTVSGAVLSTGTGEPPPDDAVDADAVLAPLQQQLHKAFVEDPYDHLNWGNADMPAQCRAMRDRILALGPWGNADAPREAMEAAGCEEQVEFNHDPTGQRLFGAVLTFTAAVIMVALIGVVSLTIVAAQFVAVVLFAVAPFAAVAAILTGGARTAALSWVSGMIRVILVVIGMSFVLSLLLLTIQALLSADTNASIIERFLLVNGATIGMFVVWRRVHHAGSTLAASIGGRLSPQAASSDKSWLAAGAVGGATGFALAGAGGSRTRAFMSNAASTRAGQTRAYRTTIATEQRALRPIARESTNIVVDETGRATRTRSVAISGGQPTTRRARVARARLERRSEAAARRHIGGPAGVRNLLRRRRGGGAGDAGGT